MIETLEKIDVSRDVPTAHLYYDPNFVQERFNLPVREKDFKRNFISFLHESILLGYFCLRDKRFKQISKVIYRLINRIRKKDALISEYVKDAFIELDSTFIKIGQFLSSRTDLLPKEYIEALSELQDSLPPIPFDEVKLLIEQELRKPLDRIFKSFNPEPIASASIGQVHRAELLSGIQVAVKIQRPNLNLLFYQDLAILRCWATFLERYTELGKGREWVEIIDEIGKTLFEEIDFIQEGKNADRFRKNLKSEERIHIPKIYWQYTTRKLLTIEFVPGIKITDLDALKEKNHDTKELAQVLVNAYFKQFFEDGFYHADPHPGNIVVEDDGTIVFYDFGMVGRINENVRRELGSVLVSVVGGDTDTLINTLKNLDLIKSEADISPLKRVIEEAAYKYYDGAKLESINLDGIQDDLNKLFEEKPMKLPSKFTYTLRMTGTLEGVCRTLDPDFSLISTAKPYLQHWIKGKLPESKWLLLKSIFPKQSKLIEKAKVYFDVIKELPKYASNIENGNSKSVNAEPKEKDKDNDSEIKYLKEDLKEANSKLKLAYRIIFLLFLVFLGSFLVQSEDYIINILGFAMLSCSLIGSIGIVAWSIFNRKVIK
ncbi:MAG: AarF/ABC1/UbiB kinase family protein [Candidatus Melainabacteria bacterium]|nr:AarF/ABC1/UbiB kinase family protein [Candidatus Melainabacteria bacterium]